MVEAETKPSEGVSTSLVKVVTELSKRRARIDALASGEDRLTAAVLASRSPQGRLGNLEG